MSETISEAYWVGGGGGAGEDGGSELKCRVTRGDRGAESECGWLSRLYELPTSRARAGPAERRRGVTSDATAGTPGPAGGGAGPGEATGGAAEAPDAKNAQASRACEPSEGGREAGAMSLPVLTILMRLYVPLSEKMDPKDPFDSIEVQGFLVGQNGSLFGRFQPYDRRFDKEQKWVPQWRLPKDPFFSESVGELTLPH